MLTRFITDVSTRFNPFSPKAKAARLFLSFLPPNARTNGMNITTQLLPRNSTETPLLYVKFKDGKEMNIDVENMGIKSIVEEVDRHSRILQKQSDLNDG
ncbi:39S ribosomal protein L53/MRP-L53-domain-containing protein [Copromyces sp. CBS 386.78]|uniref:Large ribosomal subunit protein mL53 n=1 Tax=Pseudoneurospora amorphoporcata TaxID=241081 RepID=A0AAN6NR22_9PEZI|nr:39S ribosomal protein L53/MRP-L53-domain-containing protein [Copromyces sp. CBS 386.78]KAK3950467.1 39S ribosomal protein L53/MRP-L53-domain-containing protein [Pseudoneurospora amorphoporcata]